MLKGIYKKNNYTYQLEGYDFGTNIAFFLSTTMKEAKDFIDAGIRIPSDDESDDIVYPASWDEIFLSVSGGKVKVSCYTDKSEGKTYKNRVNPVFFSRLGGIIIGMIGMCNATTKKDALDDMIGQFIPKLRQEYEIPGKGKVVLNMRALEYLEYSNGSEYLKIEEVEGHSRQVVSDTSTQHSIKLDLSEFSSNNAIDDDDWDFSGEERFYTLQEIIDRNPDKSYVWLKERKYHIVKDIKEVEEVCRKIWNHDGIVSFDTETTGLDFTFLCKRGKGDKLVGMVFAIEPGESWYFPVAHKKIQNICTPENEDYILTKYFKPILEKKPIEAHNGAFDWKVMYVHDIFINLKHDTYILPKVTLWNDHRGMELGLKELTSEFLHRDSFELSDFVSGKWGKNTNLRFWDLDEESTKYYACPDTDNALELLYLFQKMGVLEKYNATKIYEIEVAFSIVIAYQEFYGHVVDVTRAEELAKDIVVDKEKAYKEMVEIVGHDFNPRSSKDMAVVAFEELGLPVLAKTNTGNPSLDKKVRKRLLEERNPDGSYKYPFIKSFNDYLTAAQLESNFINNIDKFATPDGFLFSNVTQFLETGRVSVNNPNYQSYSDVVKKYIVPRKGYYAMDSDYSSIEYRILACMAGQQNLIEEFKKPSTDYHSYQAARMFNVPYELVTKEMRSNAKGINFGIPYGMGDPSLGARLFGEVTPENTRKASKMRRLYFEGQENVEKFFVDARYNGVKNNWSDTYFGRRRYFNPGRTSKGSIERQAGNNRIQGTAADIYKIAMVRLLNRVRKEGYLGKVLISCFIHDECFLEVHKSIDPAKMLKMLSECLMIDIKGWCPLYIGAGYGTNWYDAKKTEIPVEVQQNIIKTWGDTGLDWWDGDTDNLFYWEVGQINDFKRDQVIAYLKNEDNWGKVFKPVENSYAHEVLEELLSGRHVDGAVTKDVHTSKDMIENLEQFCIAFDCVDLFEKANIQKPDYSKTQSSNVVLDDDDEEENSDVDVMALLKARVNTMGLGFADIAGKRRLYFRYDENDPQFMSLIHKVFERNPGNIEVYALKNDEEFTVSMSVCTKAYTEALPYYLMRKNARAVV